MDPGKQGLAGPAGLGFPSHSLVPSGYSRLAQLTPTAQRGAGSGCCSGGGVGTISIDGAVGWVVCRRAQPMTQKHLCQPGGSKTASRMELHCSRQM